MVVCLALLQVCTVAAAPLGTVFTYQGRLSDTGSAFTGNAEFQATLWDAASDGSQVAVSKPTSIVVAVTNGLFVLPLDFGAEPLQTGEERWLQLEVRTTIGAFVLLSPRQLLTVAPYALSARHLSGTVLATQLTGTLPSANLTGTYTSAVRFNNADNSFIGNGSGLTSLNASQLGSGVVPDNRLAANVARTNQVWQLGGNAGTDPNADFVGTTDSAALVLRAGNQQVLRLEGATNGVRLIGGRSNVVNAASTNSAILAGRENVIEGRAHESSIAGGVDNVIRPDQRSAFIGGGARNEIQQDNQHAVIAGGRDNRIGTNTVISLVVGGGENRSGNNVDGGLMVGGFRNDILGSRNPDRRQIAPVLIGGSDNEVGYESSWTVILGGDNNRIGTNCLNAVIAGGTNNVVADGCGFSFAAGRRCRVNHVGAFVWADSQNASYASAGVDTFNIRAAGGVHLNTDTSQFFGSTTRQMVNLYGSSYGIGVQSSCLYQRSSADFSWFRGGTHSGTRNDPGTGGVEAMRLSSTGLRVNGTFVSASDRNAKQDFEAVDADDVLAKVLGLPLSRWTYKADEERARHLGPMAQDFRAAFGLGADDKHIATVDAEGVALAAIQGLNRKVETGNQRAEERIRRLEAENAELKGRLDRLERLLAETRAE